MRRFRPKQKSPSPFAGEGCGALASGSELRRSWMGGGAPLGARARKSAISCSLRSKKAFRATELREELFCRSSIFSAVALRGSRCATPHPAPPKLGLRLAKPAHPSPARGEGESCLVLV